MIKIYITIFIVMFFGQVHAGLNKCITSSEVAGFEVLLNVKKSEYEDKRTYSFQLINKSPQEIRSFVVGYGEKDDRIQGIKLNVPIKLKSPDGWDGRYVFSHESPYMHLRWRTNDMFISSGASKQGYELLSLRIPEGYLETHKFWSGDDEELKVTDYIGLSFTVRFKNAQCYWGKVTDWIE